MNCKLFDELNTLQKVNFMGQLCHAVQNDDDFFALATIIIKTADEKCMFDRVKFTHNTEPVKGIVDEYIANLSAHKILDH